MGGAGMLIQRDVFTKLGYPYFSNRPEDNGMLASEDVHFCRQARAAGFDLWVDLDTRQGHTTPATFEPVCMDSGEWAVQMRVAMQHVLTFRL